MHDGLTTYNGQGKYFDIESGPSLVFPIQKDVDFGEVLDVILEPGQDVKETIGRIKFRRLSQSGKEESVVDYAYPLSSNFRILPVKHEIVPIIGILKRFYYLNPANHSNFINNNTAAAISDAYSDANNNKSDDYSQNSSSGIPDKKDSSSDNKTMGAYFEDKNKLVSTLKHYEGDIILQGRFGNNIRFGSNSVDKTNLPQLKISLIDDEEVITKDESLDKDNCIWLTNDGKMEFTVKSIQIHKDNNAPTEYADKQIMIFTDRLVVQTKENEMIFFSNKGIHFASNLNYSVDSDKKMITHTKDNTEINTQKQLLTYSEMETKILSLKTYIGKQDVENLVIGQKWKEMMLAVLDLMIQFNQKDMKHIHPTGTGPSGPPIDPSPYTTYDSGLNKWKSSVNAEDQLSDDNFTTKKNR